MSQCLKPQQFKFPSIYKNCRKFVKLQNGSRFFVTLSTATYSQSKDFRLQEKQMTSALDAMISITHPNIVKVGATHAI